MNSQKYDSIEIRIDGKALSDFTSIEFGDRPRRRPRNPAWFFRASVPMRTHFDEFERLRHALIEAAPTNNIVAGIYAICQILLAGGIPYDAYPIARWYGATLGQPYVSDADALNLWREATGEVWREAGDEA